MSNALDAVLQALAEALRAEYVHESVGLEVAKALEDWRRKGRFAQDDPAAFAQALSAELLALTNDKHLVVRFAPDAPAQPPRPMGGAPPPRMGPAPPQQLAWFRGVDFGFRRVETLDGAIGLMSVDMFPPPFEEVRARWDAAFAALASTRGLIIDLTKNGGGHPQTVAYALSYLFDRDPITLTIFRTRAGPDAATRTTRDLGGAPYGETRPIAVAISASTFSGGEEFAYGIQALKRGVIVGQTSRGGANMGQTFPLPAGFRAFIPQGEPINETTGGNWEGVGVKPDVEAAPGDEVAKAQAILVG